MPLKDIDYVSVKLAWMEYQGIWPNGLRYLWTDAFGLVLLVSLYQETGQLHYLRQARELVDEVYRVLGRDKGLRIGEEAHRDGQYFHYLIKWVYALMVFGQFVPGYHEEALRLVQQIHPRFVLPGEGVIWKMKEDLSGPYPGSGLGALDPIDGYVVYRLLDEDGLRQEIAEMRELMMPRYRTLYIDQDLGMGMILWLCHFFANESWAVHLRSSSLRHLDRLWVDPPGYFCRQLGWREMKFAFTNYGISLGLQALGHWPKRVRKLNRMFDQYHSGDEYDRNAITHVMACTSHLPGLFLRHEPGLAVKTDDEYSGDNDRADIRNVGRGT